MSIARRLVLVLMVATVVGLLARVTAATAASAYPTNRCVSDKLKAASKKCDAVLKAWATWDKDQDAATRDLKLGVAATKFSDGWSKAEVKSASMGAECAETTLSSTDMETLVDNAVNDIVTTINGGLTLSNPDDGKCGKALVKAAGKKCKAFLKAESTYMKKFGGDPQGAASARTTAQSAASTKFTTTWNADVIGCPTTATLGDIEAKVDQLSADVVFNSTTSPSLSSSWTMISLPNPTTITYEGVDLHPICSRGTDYAYFVKRGTINKLVVYYQGGGACWDATTCSSALGASSPFDDNVNMKCAGGANSGAECTSGSECPGSTCSQFADGPDNPDNFTAGFGNLNDPSNPFKDWNAVFVSYCTGDVHWGDNKKSYNGGAAFGQYSINHKGYVNAKVVEKWTREHFVNPDEIFVTGSSAGAYGAIFHGILLHSVFPASQFNVFGDAGSGVITQDFLANSFEQAWHVQQHLPTFIPGLNADITTLTIADLYSKSANFFAPRGSHFAQYTTAWDETQTFFYNVMVNGLLDSNWWHSSCDWNSQMRQYALDAAADSSSYRYYIGPGSRHTVWGSNRAYTETHGGVPPLVDWVNDMRAGAAGWTNVECTDCSLLGTCDGSSTNAGASCQHDAECIGGSCTPVDGRPTPGQNPPNPFLADGVVDCS